MSSLLEQVSSTCLPRREVGFLEYLGELPLLDIVGARARHGVLPRVDAERAHALLVVRERRRALARRQVPEPHRTVHCSRHHLQPQTRTRAPS